MGQGTRTAVVTGSNRGLGFEIARQLARQGGIEVVATGRTEADAAEAGAKLKEMGCTGDALQLDVGDDASVRRLVAAVTERHGGIDILVNNAGVNFHDEAEASALTARFETVTATFATNVIGAWRMCQAVVPGMTGRGYGRVVNVSTEMASLGLMAEDRYPASPSYRLSKAGLNFLTVALGKELAGTDVLINAYSPGWMQTDMGGSGAPYTAEEGSRTAVWLATLPAGGPQGRFFAEMRKFGGPVALPW